MEILPSELASVKSSIELITPELARTWLASNTGNYRKLNLRSIDCMAVDISNGGFTFTNASIGFDVDGKLTDGQHRLNAVVKAGRPIWCLVVRGMPRGSADDPATDTGAKRSIATHLKNKGVANATVVAAVARYLYSLSGNNASRNKVSEARLSAVIAANPTIAEAGALAGRCGKVAQPSVIGAWVWVAMIEDAELAEECLGILSNTREASTSHPFAKLRDALLAGRMHSTTKNGRDAAQLTWRYLMASWKKAKFGESVKLLRPLSMDQSLVICEAAKSELERIWG